MFLLNRPDVYIKCFTVKSTVKMKHLVAIAQSGFDGHKSTMSRRKIQLFDIRTYNVGKS